MTRTLLALAGLYGLLGVGFGAFGAHALKARLSEDRLGNLDLAVRYLFFTIPGLVAVAWLATACPAPAAVPVAGIGLALGAFLFAGSLIALALTGNRAWGAVTPFGGVLLLIGWAGLIVAGLTLATTSAGMIAPLRTC